MGESHEYITVEDPFLGAVLIAAEVNGTSPSSLFGTQRYSVAAEPSTQTVRSARPVRLGQIEDE